MVIVRTGELVQLGHHIIRNVSKDLGARIRSESVQHTVIASHVNYCRAVGPGGCKCLVAVKRIEERRLLHKLQIRMYQIT